VSATSNNHVIKLEIQNVHIVSKYLCQKKLLDTLRVINLLALFPPSPKNFIYFLRDLSPLKIYNDVWILTRKNKTNKKY